MKEPLDVGQLQEGLFIQTPRMAVVHVFERGLMAKLGLLVPTYDGAEGGNIIALSSSMDDGRGVEGNIIQFIPRSK